MVIISTPSSQSTWELGMGYSSKGNCTEYQQPPKGSLADPDKADNTEHSGRKGS